MLAYLGNLISFFATTAGIELLAVIVIFAFFRRQIDNWLNNITMYRLVLYVLIALLLIAAVLGALGILPYSPVSLVFSTLVLFLASWLANIICAKIIGVPANVESAYITALILALIISPPVGSLTSNLSFLIAASVLAMASKYILNIGGKHIFNPAALAVALTALTVNQSASWWVGTSSMFIFTLIGGLLITRKVQRFDAVLAFLIGAYGVMFALEKSAPQFILQKSLLDSPVIFFSTIMLTEPLTMPPTRDGRLAYGLLAGWMFAPQTHVGSFYFTPELALLAGNVFSYLISPKGRHSLRLKQKIRSGAGVMDFVLESDRPLRFRPGQYMEWTLGHKQPDNRGNRRYFTLANSPTESDVLLGIKFYHNPSSFKQALANMKIGDTIVAGQLSGDFTLPRDARKKLVFVAGGIGITPFRSMLKYLIDKGEKRDIIILYSNRAAEEIVYVDVLTAAARNLGIKTVCTLTNPDGIPANWQGQRGYLDSNMIAAVVPDFDSRTFYISGSHAMVTGVHDALARLGVPRRRIITDFFPGLA